MIAEQAPCEVVEPAACVRAWVPAVGPVVDEMERDLNCPNCEARNTLANVSTADVTVELVQLNS